MAENKQGKTSYAKGEEFERLFAEFMKSDLGWDGCRIRAQQKGKANSKGVQVDIIATKKDDRYRKLYNAGLLFFIVFVCGLILGSIVAIDSGVDTGFYIMGLSLIPGIAGIYCLWDCEHYHKENAWVECKNRKGKTTFEQVQKSVNEYKDWKASGDKEHKYVAHYFVSANGFVENALKYAIDNKVICYEFKNEIFKKVEYWN